MNLQSLKRTRLIIANFIGNSLLPRYFNGARGLRAWVFRVIGGIEIGRNVRMYGGTYILGRKVSIGDNTFIGADCFFACSDSVEITIGKNCDISFGVCFMCGTHEIGDSHKRAGVGTNRPIRIGNGVWIGCRATVLGGVTIGKGAVVGAASLVNKDVTDNVVVAGVPAKVTRELKD